jgi:tryptophanyl-tRNA synthetase
MSKPRLLSGMQPTGLLHLGNLEGALANWVGLQDDYEAYFLIADWHALTTLYDRTELIKQYTREVAIDFLAAGLDPERSAIFVQSDVKEHAELHLLLSMVTPVSWLERVPSYKEKQTPPISPPARGGYRGGEAISYGLMGYPVLQAADILAYKADAVPVGKDQLPHLELAREIGRRFNYIYGRIFPDCKALMTDYAAVPGIDGRKMSKSYNNAVYIADSPEDTINKIRSMHTDPRKIHKEDQGHRDGCTVYEMLALYGHPELHEDCEAGRLGCLETKYILAELINDRLAPIRERRAHFAENPQLVDEILAEGAEKARVVARETLGEVRRVMKLR